MEAAKRTPRKAKVEIFSQTANIELSHNEKTWLKILSTGPALWGSIYCKEIDKLMKRKYIEWDHIDARGQYFNRIKLSEAGMKAYANATKGENRV